MGKKPFSGKQKRDQLQKKRVEKRVVADQFDGDKGKFFQDRRARMKAEARAKREASGGVADPRSRLRTVFARMSDVEVKRRRELSRLPLTRDKSNRISFLEEDGRNKTRENSTTSENVSTSSAICIDIPKRPRWTRAMSKVQLESQEEKYFNQWKNDIFEHFDANRLNYFEQNLEVWRQLWRVVEQSDILLLVADARHPLFHFPISLYRYIVEVHRKPFVLVLNKIDLIPARVLHMWSEYFTKNFPQLTIVLFTSFPQDGNVTLEIEDELIRMRKRIRRKYNAYGVESLLDAVLNVAMLHEGSNLSSFTKELIDAQPELKNRFHGIEDPKEWLNFQLDVSVIKSSRSIDSSVGTTVCSESDSRMESEVSDRSRSNSDSSARRGRVTSQATDDEDEEEERGEEEEEDETLDSTVQTGSLEEDAYAEDENSDGHVMRRNPFLTIGTIGHPNVGKSSLINGLVGKKVVSTSATPGHTKHLQTVFLPQFPAIRLCDCPGLTFPSLLDRSMQIVLGLFPIAQVQEPFSSVSYLAERLPIEQVYQLSLLEDAKFWSGWAICESYAVKRGYLTRNGAPDAYRAANEILRDCLAGRLVLYFYPPETPLEEVENVFDVASIGHPSAGRSDSSGYANWKRPPVQEEEEEEEPEESAEEGEEEEDYVAGRLNAFSLLSEE